MKLSTPQILAALAIINFWILFTGARLGLSAIPYLLKGKEFPIYNKLVYQSSWLLWSVLTFLVIYVARKIPLEKGAIGRWLSLHAGIGMGVTLLHAVLSLCIKFPLLHLFDLPTPKIDWIVPMLSYHAPLFFGVYVAIVGVTNAYDYYIRYRQGKVDAARLESELAKAELRSLKMQLHPHFLFNTHHSIVSLMLAKRNDDAINMLTRLSDLLRITIEHTNKQLSSLKEELDTLDLYLSIQKVRFQDRLQINSEYRPETLNAEVPYLILQPIAENAIKHGIDTLTSGGCLTIETRRVGDELELSVCDNGPGMDVSSALESKHGIGMKLSRSRLERLYGDRQSIIVDSSSNTGTKVIIRIPFTETPRS